MNCNCSLAHNYEVVGLCDLEMVNGGNPIPKGEAWVQITVPEVLTIPDCKPPIEGIDKIYISAYVNSTRIIETPTSPLDTEGNPIPNVEGVTLTGRKLLVDGYLCQDIVYTANNCTQTVHSSNFKVPFSTYIVIDGKADLELDQYCVEVCIEDVFARVLSDRSIFKNVTLFLAAQKSLTPECL